MCNNRIVVLTLTFNRPENLKRLFSTLKRQTNKNFVWMIVDDGSPQNLMSVVSEFRAVADFEIVYYYKENGGKASATNYAFDHLNINDFVVVVDDDELLYPEAIDTVHVYERDYMDSKVGIINFTRNTLDDTPIANPYIDHDYIMSGEERWRRNYHSDGYIAYYMRSVGNCRYPIFEGEKFMGESVLVGMISENSTILWSSKALGKTAYLNDGLTKAGRLLRLKCPRGMALYSMIVQSGKCGIKNKIKYASSYYAYLKYAKINEIDFHKDWKYRLYMPLITKRIASLIVMCWRKKYGDLYQ